MKKKDNWQRDEFQTKKTGEIDTRGLYLAMGLLLILATISNLGINWASTGTQMIGILSLLILHQLFEQMLGFTDSYFLNLGKTSRIIWGIFFMIAGINLLSMFFNSTPFKNGQITFSGMLKLMSGICLFAYSILIWFITYKEKKTNND